MKKIFFLAVLAALTITAKAQIASNSTLNKTGDMAPGFNFSISKDKTANLQEYHGKIVLLNFWATWCPPCREELPRVQKEIWQKYQDNPKFALLAFAREEGWEKVLPFKRLNRYTFPMLPDENRSIFKLYATQEIPRTVLLDESGKIIYQAVGYSDEEFSKLLSVLKKQLKTD